MEYNPIQLALPSYIAKLPEYQAGPFEWRMSATGECPRALDYDLLLGKDAVPVEAAMRFLIGHAIHDGWQELMKRILGDDFEDVERDVKVAVSYRGVTKWIPGHPDGVIKSLDAVWEFKTVSENTFQMVQSQSAPIGAHIEQANLYAYALKKRYILFHYVNRNTGDALFFTVPYNEELTKASYRKWQRRIHTELTGEMEPRPYFDPTESPCWFCRHREDCYKDFDGEVSRMAVKVLENAEIAPEVLAADGVRTDRLSLDKQEKKHKAAVANWMLKNEIKEMIVIEQGSKFKCSIKLGVNNNPIVTIKEMK